MRRGGAADRAGRIEHGFVNRQQFRGLEQLVHALQQFLQFSQLFELQLLQLLEFLHVFELFQFDRIVLQFRGGRWRVEFQFEQLVLRLGFVRRLRTEHEALGAG